MRVCTLENGGDDELGFEDGRDVFEGVNDEVDLVGGESSFEFGCPEGFRLEEVESLGSEQMKKVGREGGRGKRVGVSGDLREEETKTWGG